MLKRFASTLMRFDARAADEREAMRNRLAMACVALVAAFAAQAADEEARAFFRAALPILLAYMVGAAVLTLHMSVSPAVSPFRIAAAMALDALAVAAAMSVGGGAAGWLFPLFVWMIFGAGVRLGAGFLALAVALSLAGFGLVAATTPFWRDHAALSVSLMLSLVALPVHGAVLLRPIVGARAQAERDSRAKTLFLASVSHELRTPLTAIVGLTGLLERSRLDAEQRDMTRTLSEAAQTLLRQIEHLLAGARDEIGGEAAEDETVDFFALLLSLRAMLAVEADAKGVRLGLTIEAETPRHIRGDRRRLHEILQNVVGNAVKFTREGAVAVRVGARRRDGALWLTLEVRDTGPGIPAAAQQRIFEPFRQGDASIREKFGGAGLGLSIVRQRLAAMGGEISVESFGAGATFRLGWPATPVAAGEGEPESRGDEPVCLEIAEDCDSLAIAARHDLAVLIRGADASGQTAQTAKIVARRLAALRRAPEKRLKILLAEDNAVNSRVLEKILSDSGEVRAVADGEAALLLMLREEFDVILLDVNMPRLGGVAAARIYAAARPSGRAPVLALTADDSAESRKSCRAAGMADCLRKPIAAEALRAAVAAAVEAAGQTPGAPAAEAGRGAQLDAGALSALDRLGGAEFVRALLVQFAGDAALLVEDIHASLERGDIASASRQAHALESMAGNMGAAALARLCRGWRGMNAKRLSLSAARESERLRRRWRLTQNALGRALART